MKDLLKLTDYYQILGLGKDCTSSQLKKAYLKLAKEFHPDRNRAPGSTKATQLLVKAYTVLSDPEKRQKGGRSTQRGGRQQQKHQEAKKPSPSFRTASFSAVSSPCLYVLSQLLSRRRPPFDMRTMSMRKVSSISGAGKL